MSEFENWLREEWKDYRFTRRKIEHGERLVGKWKVETKDGRDGLMVFMYHITERKPITEAFASFLNDFERVYDGETDEKEDNDGTEYALDWGNSAYFVLYGDYDKEAFNLLLKKAKWYLIDRVKIKSLSPFGGYFGETRNEK